LGNEAGSVPRYFSAEEIEGLSLQLVDMLDHARGLAKVPFRITSGFRTPEQNRAADGVWDSAHTRGLAVDLACFDSRARLRMISGLIMAGFIRIGVYSRHLHIDIDPTLPQDVLWFGGESH
jgi:zinc D-Ala-D-Ala carboxypeptidase